MKTKVQLKNLYLIAVIAIGLIGLGVGSTFAMFNASTSIDNPIAFNSNLSSINLLAETIEVTVPAGEDKYVDIVISNTSSDSLNYTAWYSPTSNDLVVGSTSSNNSYGPVGILPTSANFTLTVQLRNKGDTPITVTIGVSSSVSNIILPNGVTVVPSEPLPTKDFYNMLKNLAAEGRFAKKYEGEHQDSMNASESNKDIYYFYAGNAADGNTVRNMNNVVFGGQCWQIIRTTDTGGIKLLYNGEPTITGTGDNISYDCGDSRPGHIGGIRTTKDLKGNFVYGNGYTTSVSGTTTTYTLTDTQSITVNTTDTSSTITNIAENYPYTCGTTSNSCTTLYKVDSYSNGTSAYVYASTFRDVIGASEFNKGAENTIAAAGYMYNKKYSMNSIIVSEAVETSNVTLNSAQLTNYRNYWFGDSYTMNGNKYVLSNRVKGSTIEDNPSTWKNMYYYTCTSTSSCDTLYYITNVVVSGSSTTLYRIMLSSGKQIDDTKYLFGDSITDNGDGTFIINSPVEILQKDWNANYTTNYMVNKYVCMPGYYTYDSNTDTYTCSDNGEQNVGALRYVTSSNGSGFTATKIYKYGYGIEAYNDRYKLVGKTVNDSIETGTLQYILNWPSAATTNCFANSDSFSECGNRALTKSHYTCYNLSGICKTYYYYHKSVNNSNAVNTIIPDGKYVSTDTTDPNNILYLMLRQDDENGNVNTNNSTVKSYVDAWYQKELYNDYDDYIDDTIYCNDRSISAFNSFNPNGGIVNSNNLILFYGNGTSLSCKNVTDRFSASNPKAQLTYKVGLISYPEMNLLNSNNARTATNRYWLMGAHYLYQNQTLYSKVVNVDGSLSLASGSQYIRPAISLKATANDYISGDGSYSKPYIVE